MAVAVVVTMAMIVLVAVAVAVIVLVTVIVLMAVIVTVIGIVAVAVAVAVALGVIHQPALLRREVKGCDPTLRRQRTTQEQAKLDLTKLRSKDGRVRVERREGLTQQIKL
eukprot:CAMPEP_0181233448 /NCGR_PEP_ID=MMETSP1096-20121128/36341_1 /TAXON_ID=156174 ORGANISM="Chrysochromulina ericina, Strain CCMP281" /NCGR_SAMPLE_ID=MMETSP1096 /ASSEMBLY_ACC=CAM_ASM_000453 /LENGTH=109 /DNA_ID=CAMNT_0023327949 /DNA_START=1226 /DNA_END=1552 /DNA_ORIENTATION=-